MEDVKKNDSTEQENQSDFQKSADAEPQRVHSRMKR